jgi:enoyl-CoA hydratase
VLDIEDHSGVTVVRFRHGKVNALDLELLKAITAAVREVDDDRAMVLTGAGGSFCAGVDLKRIVDGGPAYVQEFMPALSEAFLAIFDHPGPALAAVDGHAIAGGCVIAAACDLRVMSAGKIGLAELSVGVPFPTSALEILRHAVGAAASQLVLTAALLEPAQAQSIGLIDHLEPSDSLLEASAGHAQRMARVPAEVYSFSKRQLQRPAREQIAARTGEDDKAVLACWSAERTMDAIAGYLDALDRRPRPAR